MIKITDSKSINKDDVSSVEVLSRHYVNGSSRSLKITLRNGIAILVDHNPQYLGGVDIFELKRKLES